MTSSSTQSLLNFYNLERFLTEDRDECRLGLWMSVTVFCLILAAVIFGF